jgi:hypothetical protein
VEREPGFLEQNIKLVRQEVSTIASQLQKVVFLLLLFICYPCSVFVIFSAVLMEYSTHLYVSHPEAEFMNAQFRFEVSGHNLESSQT